MTDTTQYPEFPSEDSDDSVPAEPQVEETPEPEAPAPEPEEEGSETAVEAPVMDVYSVPEAGTDPTNSAQSGDESGLEMDELVKQVREGKWGNGQQRRNRLAAAGYDHVEVYEALTAAMNLGRQG